MRLIKLITGLVIIFWGCHTKEVSKDDNIGNPSFDYDSMGNICLINNNIEGAWMYYDTALKIDSNNLLAKWGKVNIEFGRSNFKKGLKLLNEIITVDSTFEEAYFYRGKVYFREGELDLALKDFNTSIRLGYEISDCYVRIAQIYGEIKDYKMAEKNFNLAVANSPNSPKHYIERSYFYLYLGDTIKFCNDYMRSKNLGLIDSIVKGEYIEVKEDIGRFNSICKQ